MLKLLLFIFILTNNIVHADDSKKNVIKNIADLDLYLQVNGVDAYLKKSFEKMVPETLYDMPKYLNSLSIKEESFNILSGIYLKKLFDKNSIEEIFKDALITRPMFNYDESFGPSLNKRNIFMVTVLWRKIYSDLFFKKINEQDFNNYLLLEISLNSKLEKITQKREKNFAFGDDYYHGLTLLFGYPDLIKFSEENRILKNNRICGLLFSK